MNWQPDRPVDYEKNKRLRAKFFRRNPAFKPYGGFKKLDPTPRIHLHFARDLDGFVHLIVNRTVRPQDIALLFVLDSDSNQYHLENWATGQDSWKPWEGGRKMAIHVKKMRPRRMFKSEALPYLEEGMNRDAL